MELTEYIRLFRKWFWLLLVFAFVGGGLSFIINTGKAPVYSASATISIGRFIDSPNPNTADIQTGIGLAQTYAQLIRTTDVLQGTVDALKLTMTPQQLGKLFTTDILTGTSLLVVNVDYTDLILTADIANTLAQQLILRSPTNLTTGQQAQIDYANAQIDALDKQLQQQRQSLDSINTQLASTQDAAEITRLTDLKTQLTEQVTQASAAIAQFQSTISTIQQRTNALDIVERATIPTSPLGSNTIIVAITGAAVGAVIAMGLVLLIDYLDDRIRTAEAAVQLLELPVLGAIPNYGKKTDSYASRLITKEESMSQVAESYRRLQTNLMFASTNGRKNVFVVTSPGPEEGKSITAANLAATMANDGIHVLLIDADLRRPRQHEIFGLENEVGLSTLLIANADGTLRSESGHDRPSLIQLNQCIQLTAIPKLRVITSGFVPSNPTQILRSSLMKRWIDAFRSATDIDVIIIDTPPVLLFGDSAIVSTIAEADSVLIVDSQHTRSKAAIASREQLVQVGAVIKGVVLNRINPHDEAARYGYGYGYGYYYEPTAQPKEKRSGLQRLIPRR